MQTEDDFDGLNSSQSEQELIQIGQKGILRNDQIQ